MLFVSPTIIVHVTNVSLPLVFSMNTENAAVLNF